MANWNAWLAAMDCTNPSPSSLYGDGQKSNKNMTCGARVLVMGREKPGVGAVILPESADSNPSLTTELACHASTSGNCVLFLSLLLKT